MRLLKRMLFSLINIMSTVNNLCSPALIYLIFSLTHVIIDIFKEDYNQSFFKFIVMIFFTILLHLLCQRGLGVISWLLVFIPFISLSFFSAMLLYVFGLNPSKGKLSRYDITPTRDQIRREMERERRHERKYRRKVKKFEDYPNSKRDTESLSETKY